MDITAENKVANPIIIYPTTKKLHPFNPLKYFGHMSQQFILDQYDKFTEYDKNGDGSLDLTEVVKVVQYLGFTFNAHQLQEAMEEVDKDHNHTLDFYEYLLIIDNIYRRNGKATLFQEGLSEIKKKNPTVSKSCAIQ